MPKAGRSTLATFASRSPGERPVFARQCHHTDARFPRLPHALARARATRSDTAMGLHERQQGLNWARKGVERREFRSHGLRSTAFDTSKSVELAPINGSRRVEMARGESVRGLSTCENVAR